MKMQVLVTAPLRAAAMKLLEKKTQVEVAPDEKQETIAGLLPGFDGIITRNAELKKETLKKGKRLQVIGCHGIGVDLVDVHTATEMGIPVINTPGANSWSVAELIVGSMLALSRHLIQADNALRVEGRYELRDKFIGSDLRGKTLGIVGMGNIGRNVAQICKQGFGMEVLGFDPGVAGKEMDNSGVEKCLRLEILLQKADFLSLNCPLNEKTEGMIGKEELQMMKKSSFLINFARGGLVEEKAALSALEEGEIAGAAFDVFWEEPLPGDHPLLSLPNVIATPHIAAFSKDSLDNMSEMVARDVLRVLQGEKPENPVNPEVIGRRNNN